MISSLLLCALASSPAHVPDASTQEKWELRFVFPEGSALKYRNKTETEGTVMENTTTATVTFTQIFTVGELTDKGRSLAMSMEDMEISNESEESPPDLDEMLEKMKFTIVVDPQGLIVETISESDDEEAGIARQMFGGVMSGMQGMGFMGFTYPKEPVGVGSKWETSFDPSKIFTKIPMFTDAEGTVDTACEIMGAHEKDGRMFVDIRATTKAEITATVSSPDGQTLEMKISVTGETTHTVDRKTGLVERSKGTATTVSDMSIFKMEQKSTIAIERLWEKAV